MKWLDLSKKEDRILGKLIDIQADFSGEDIWLMDDSESISFSQAKSVTDEIADIFIRLGIQKGEVIAMILPPSVKAVLLACGISKAGGVFAPISFDYRNKELEDAIIESGARIAVAEYGVTAILDEVSLPDSMTVLFIHQHSLISEMLEHIRSRIPDNISHSDMSSPAETGISASDALMILRTSGTTGKSKWVIRSHNGEFHSKIYTCPGKYRKNDITYICLSDTHTAFWGNVFNALVTGTAVAIDPVFSARAYWSRVRHFSATRLVLTGALVSYVWDQPYQETDIDNRVWIAYFTPIKADMVSQFKKRYGFECMSIGYGCTETGALAQSTNIDWPGADTYLGEFFPVFQVALLNEDNNSVSPGATGEICVKTNDPDNFFMGYLNDPDATAAKYTEGWYHTGDLGREEDGKYYYCGRTKDAIRRKGENISLYEVERLINRCPGIKECAAYGVPSEKGASEELLAVSVISEDGTQDAKKIADFVYENGPHYFVPDYILFTDDLPQNKTGRTVKRVLQANFSKELSWCKPKDQYLRHKLNLNI